MRQNTLNLVGDGDELDIIRDAQDQFEVEFADRELSAFKTVGGLYDLIIGKYRARHPRTESCLSQAAFYRLRSAMGAMGADCPIAPATVIAVIGSELPGNGNTRQKWLELARRAGLTLPRLELAWMRSDVVLPRPLGHLGWVALGLIFVLVAGAITKLTGLSFGWTFLTAFLGGILGWVLVLEVLPLWFGDVPRRIETIGDLAREAAGHSFAALRREKRGCSPLDVWLGLLAILRDASGHTGEINRETTFFAHSKTPQR